MSKDFRGAKVSKQAIHIVPKSTYKLDMLQL